MESACSNCGSCDFDSNAGHAVVCKSCGVVIDDAIIDGERDIFQANSKFHFYATKRKSNGLSSGLNTLDVLSSKYAVAPDLKEAAAILLKHIYSYKRFKTIKDVDVLAGCCLVHTLQNHDQHISLKSLCNDVQCSMKSAYKFSKLVKSHCAQQYATYKEGNSNSAISGENNDLDIKWIKTRIHQMFSDIELDIDKQELIKKAIALIKLGSACWLTTGRGMEGIIAAASFLCWKNMQAFEMNLKQFCTKLSMSYATVQCRASELKAMLTKLAQKIPSFTKKRVTGSNVLLFLDYILENSETLRNDLLDNEFTEEDINKKEYSEFRKIRSSTSKSTETPEEDNTNGLAEISDSEISSYIRSEREVQLKESLVKEYDIY
ncbi:uncharacterized protein CDAR_447861 [Caerostris darwini]|uniref:BRF2-like C-terminal domain-containing protein n=1 Tax=Caerostris darwini TaxID=1538125 RepID=A0AAV4PU44_9ARAC|nr:uncharacterized protein CDAR_447861 [Caerostris darwini]